MNIKVIAIPAIALAAGFGLSACGASGTPAAAPTVTVTPAISSSAPSGQAAACADWQQARAASTTAEGNGDIQDAMNALGPSLSAAGSNSALYGYLQKVYISANEGSGVYSPGGVQMYGAAIDKICGTSAAPVAAPAPASPVGVWFGTSEPNGWTGTLTMTANSFSFSGGDFQGTWYDEGSGTLQLHSVKGAVETWNYTVSGNTLTYSSSDGTSATMNRLDT
jgi:hypothetical protein